MLGVCSECGKEVSSRAKSCPHCGAPVTKTDRKLAGCLAVVAVLTVLSVIASLNGKNADRSVDARHTEAPAEAAKRAQAPAADSPAATVEKSRTKVKQPPAATTKTDPSEAKASKHLRVSRADMQQAFSGEPFWISFQAATSVQGQPRVMGQTPDGLATVELIGPPSGLISASCLVGLPNDSPEILTRNSVALLVLLKKGLPTWSGSADWLPKGLEQAMATGKAQTTVAGARVGIQYIEAMGIMSLTIEALQ